jgi:hypothetical protein
MDSTALTTSFAAEAEFRRIALSLPETIQLAR